MADAGEFGDDFFDDIYGDDNAAQPSEPTASAVQPEPEPSSTSEPLAFTEASNGVHQDLNGVDDGLHSEDANMNGSSWNDGSALDAKTAVEHDDNYGPIGIKEDG